MSERQHNALPQRNQQHGLIGKWFVTYEPHPENRYNPFRHLGQIIADGPPGYLLVEQYSFKGYTMLGFWHSDWIGCDFGFSPCLDPTAKFEPWGQVLMPVSDFVWSHNSESRDAPCDFFDTAFDAIVYVTKAQYDWSEWRARRDSAEFGALCESASS